MDEETLRLIMVCKDNLCDYDSFYKDQAGGNLDISYYKGYQQSGRGIITSFAKRYGFPVIKYLSKHAYQAGKDIISDISTGSKFSTAAKKAGKKRLGSVLTEIGEKLQSGKGLRKKPRITRKISKRKTKKVKKSIRSKSKRVKRGRKNSQRNLIKSDIFKL